MNKENQQVIILAVRELIMAECTNIFRKADHIKDTTDIAEVQAELTNLVARLLATAAYLANNEGVIDAHYDLTRKLCVSYLDMYKAKQQCVVQAMQEELIPEGKA